MGKVAGGGGGGGGGGGVRVKGIRDRYKYWDTQLNKKNTYYINRYSNRCLIANTNTSPFEQNLCNANKISERYLRWKSN